MDMRRLQAFAQVYTQRSFSRAGEELLLSQPSISAHIQALEEELGAPLFDRLGRTVLPTPAGEVLYTQVKTVFSALDQARADILALSNRVAGELVIGGSTIPAHYIIPRLAARFLGGYPEVRLQVRVGDTEEIIRMIHTGEVQAGLVGGPTAFPDLVSQPFLDDTLLLLAPAAMPLPELIGPDWRERLMALPWVMREPGSGTRQALAQAFTAANLDLRDIDPVLTVSSSLAALECVEAGLGVAVVSHLAARAYCDRGAIRRLDVPGLAMRRQFHLVHHAKRHQFPALLAFLTVCCSGLAPVPI